MRERPAGTSPVDALTTGSRIREWKVERFLARGAYGQVFSATRDSWEEGPTRALKVFDPILSSAARQGLVDEFALLRGVRHPHLIEGEDAFDIDDGPLAGCVVFVMEQAEVDLASVIDHRGPLEPARVAAIGAQLADGLAALHDRGHLHGDVKPENALRTGGLWKLGDFGVSASLQGSYARPVGATLDYRPPEVGQAGSSGWVHRSADVWALGTTLWVAATGLHPFVGIDPVVRHAAVLRGDRQPAPEVDPALAELIDGWCLVPDPHARASAADLADELRLFLERAGGPSAASGATPAAEEERWSVDPVDRPAGAEASTPTWARDAPPTHGLGVGDAVPDVGSTSPDPGRPPAPPAPSDPAGAASLPLLPLPPAADDARERSGFVGRRDELVELTRLWRTVVAGDRRLVTLVGEPGVGKTRLARHFAQQVHRDGGQVLWGRCAAENLIAFQPVAEAMRTAVADLPDDVARAAIRSRPALRMVLHDTMDLSGSDRAERFQLYESLAELCGEMSAVHPVLLVVDDLQWADPSTTALLRQVLLHDRSGRVLVLATRRQPAGRPTDDVDRLLSDLGRDHLAEVLTVGGLSSADVSELLATRGVALEAEAAEAVRDRTAGNPFFVESLLDHGGDLATDDVRSLPGSVRGVLDQRLAGLDAEATRVLTAAAVIGLRVELDLLGEVTGLGPDALLDVVDPAVEVGLLAEDEALGWVTFPHALVRQALIARTTRNREARMHLAVADAVERRPGSVDRAAVLAQHLWAAGGTCPPERAARAAIAAGEEAFALLADAEARTWARRAQEVLDRVATDDLGGLDTAADLLLAASSRNLADIEVARRSVGRVVARARASGDGMLMARAVHERAQVEAGVGFTYGAVDEDLVELLAEALALLPDDRPAERALLLAWTSITLIGADDAGPDGDHVGEDDPAAVAAEAWALAQEVDGRPDVRALGAFARRLALAGPDGLPERRTLRPVMLAAARAARWSEMEVIALLLDAVELLEDDRVEDALAARDQMRLHLSAGDRPMFDVYLHFLDGALAILRGDLAAAEVHSLRGLEIGASAHGDNAAQGWGAQQFLMASYRGTVAELTEVVEEFARRFPSMPAWTTALATCRVGAGDLEGAREAYTRGFTADGLVLHQDQTWYTTVAQLAEVAWYVDDADLARRLLPLIEPVADRMAITGLGAICLGHMVRQRGLVRAVLGHLDEAIADLERACRRSEECGFEPPLARALVELADVHRRRGRPGDEEVAAGLQARGEELADRLGIRVRLVDL